MLSETLQYYNPKIEEYVNLEEWMKFSLFLGDFLKSFDGKIKMYVSTPSNLLVSYIVALGAINSEFENISYNSMREQYLQLKKGNKVYYNSDDVWKLCSILGVVPHPKDKTKLAIALLDHKKTTVYVPEDNWDKYIRINSLEQSNIKNAYKIKHIENLASNEVLTTLYPKENITCSQNRNVPEILLFANKKEWLENLSMLAFEVKGIPCTLKDFIYLDIYTQFKNLEFISQNGSEHVPEKAMVIFVGASRSIRKMDEFKNQKNLYLIDRHENIEKIESLKEKIEQQIITGNMEVKNLTLVEAMNKRNIAIPKGVEIFAWG